MSKQRRRVRAAVLLVTALSVGFTAASAAARAIPQAPELRSSSFMETMVEPFGIGGEKLRHGELRRKWQTVTRALQAERKTLAQCREQLDSCPPAAKRFLALIDRALAREGRNRIAEINRAINLVVRPVDDMTQYGVEEFWASPLTTFATNAGDCEDYAIAKYAALLEMGVADTDLRLVVVRDESARDYHAVAAVRHEGSWLILDNRTFGLREDKEIGHFSPKFVLDAHSVKPLATRAPAVENRHVAQNDETVAVSSAFGSPVSPYLL